MIRYIRSVLTILFLTALFATPIFAQEGANPSLERVETILYGAVQQGGLMPRLSQAEKDLFGRELPGSLTERQSALRNYLEDGTANNPPMLFKLAVCEWIVVQKVSPSVPMVTRVSSLEQSLEGSVQAGPVGARLERLITKLLPEGIQSQSVSVPKSTVLKARFIQNVTVRNVRVGDPIVLELNEDCIVSGSLVAARGGRVFAEVTSVKRPRSFGRPSEIKIDFKNVEALDGNLTAVFVGSSAKKAMQVDSAAIGAAGASLAGAIVLGPLGLATGFLVRGNDKQIDAGSLIYVETTEQSNVLGYLLPQALQNRAGSPELSPQGAVPSSDSGSQSEAK